MKSWLVIALVLLAALPLQVAAKDTPSSPSPDLQFIDMMVPHHEHGIKMARMAEEKAELPKLKSFAARSAIDQEKDIPELKSLRERFYANQPKADRIRMHEKTMMLDEMDRMSQKDMQKLEAASGAEFDKIFLDVFANHHQMAIDMAKDEVKKGTRQEVQEKARELIEKQGKDIKEMQQMKKAVNTK